MRPVVRIAEPGDFSPAAAARLAEVAELVMAPCAAADVAAAVATCDVFWFRLGHRLTADVLNSARCKVIATPVTGLDHIDLAACAARGIQVVSLRGETEFLRQIRATAELTIGLLLALIRRIPAAHASVLEGGWDRDRFRGTELHGKVAGIVGVGRLGTIVADLLRSFGMTVLGFDPRPDFPDGVDRVEDLGELFARCDVITIHAAYPETHHLIDGAVLARARPGLVLVNTARGAIVDSAALLAALTDGRITGAALDVIEGEPEVGRSHPLVGWASHHDNLIIVPHLGGNTSESFDKTERFLAERVIQAMRATGLIA